MPIPADCDIILCTRKSDIPPGLVLPPHLVRYLPCAGCGELVATAPISRDRLANGRSPRGLRLVLCCHECAPEVLIVMPPDEESIAQGQELDRAMDAAKESN